MSMRWCGSCARSCPCCAVTPAVTLTIVGGNPGRAVQQLAREAGVEVTGRVPDVRPYLKHAFAVLAPMRIARGVQNKVLEGMAMARPVLVSRKGLEGIAAGDGEEVLLAESAADYRRLLGELIRGEHDDLGRPRPALCAAALQLG